MDTKDNIWGCGLDELTAIAERFASEKFRGKQLYSWLYDHPDSSFADMTNLPAKLLEQLDQVYRIEKPKILNQTSADDGTVKFLMLGQKGQKFEAVWLPFEKRTSICISSQSGCSIDCSFCATGKLTFKGNLSSGDIIGQVDRIQEAMGKQASNVVFMGMGEPFYNYDNVIQAAQILSHGKIFSFSSKKITISTAGVYPKLKLFLEQRQPYGLAISLNASSDIMRSELMPINDRYNMELLREIVLEANSKLKKIVTFEYVMIKNVNISREDAKNLINYVKGLKTKINLIPVNTSFAGQQRPTDQEIQQFIQWLEPLKKYKIPVLNRESPAKDINGACGMLAFQNS